MSAPHPSGEPLRILWLTATTGSPGAARLDIGLARALARDAIEIHVVAPAGSFYARAAGEAGLELIEYPPRGLLGRAGRRNIRSCCVDRGIDLVHSLDPLATAAALPALRDPALPLVARHDRVGGVRGWNPLARLTVLHPRLDQVVCTSEAGRIELARRRDPATVSLIPPGCEPSWYSDRPASLAHIGLGLPADAFAIAVVADYRVRAGIEYLVDSAAWLPADANAHFLMIGAGHETRSVLERISRSPWRANFHLLGPRFDAAQITAACAVSVRAAIRAEGIPQALVESMACGVPPIVTDVGAARELVAQGESGIIVARRSARAIGEALAWLFVNPAERTAMGRAARARITGKFGLTQAVDLHVALYRSLCARRRTPSGDAL